jgi:N-succinyldiaminopimelate aminotransferase
VQSLLELHEAMADPYNRLYRRGMPSQYTAENVSISEGGYPSLTRVAASLDHINLGHFLPDYTAYEELLDIFNAFTAIPILLETAATRSPPRIYARRSWPAASQPYYCQTQPHRKSYPGDELARWAQIARAGLRALAG